jgi:hypothetical protein
MASRVKDIRKIGSVNKGLSLSRPKSSSGAIAPEFLLGTRGPVSVDENGSVSRKISSHIMTGSFDGFSLSDLGQRIEEQRRELARERQQTFGGILSDVQGLSNNLLAERNKADADRQRCSDLELRNSELEALLKLLQQQLLQQQQLQQPMQTQRPQTKQAQAQQLASNLQEHQPSLPLPSAPAACSVSVGSQCCSSSAHSAAQTDEQEPVPTCSDNFVWCKTCESSASALAAAEVAVRQSKAELVEAEAAFAQQRQRDRDMASDRRALGLQVEQLQNLLLLESGRAAEIQNSSESQLSTAAAEFDGQRQRWLQQQKEMDEQRREVEFQLQTLKQEQQHTRAALEEALRESAAASAIEEHVKAKLAAAQHTNQQQKLELAQQLAASATERAAFQQQLLQKDEQLKQAQAHVAELKQRCSCLPHAPTACIHSSTLTPSPPRACRCVAFETQHTKETKTQSLSSSTHEREVVVIDKSRTSSAGAA